MKQTIRHQPTTCNVRQTLLRAKCALTIVAVAWLCSAINGEAFGQESRQAPALLPMPTMGWLSKLGGRYQPRAFPVQQSYQGPPTSIDGPAFPESHTLPGITASPANPVGPPETIDAPPQIELPLGAEGEGATLPYFSVDPHGPMLDAESYFIPGQHLSDYRDGFFQRLSLSAAWIGAGNDPGDLGVTEIDSFLMVALPAPIVEWPLLVSPTFNTRLFNGPPGSDIPAHVFEAYVDFTWLPLIVNRWRLLINVTPGVFSDFKNTESGSFRMNGKAVAIYDLWPNELQLVGGLVYLNRQNLRALPVLGAIWTPQSWLRFELIFPKPKIAARLNIGQGYEDWVYLMAEYGGNSWAVQRSGGVDDFMTYNDYRIVSGFERRLDGGAGYRFEAGVAFGRTLQFRSGLGNFDPKTQLFLRGGITF